MAWRDRYEWYPRFPKSTPRQAKGGIKAQSKRGEFGKSWWAKRWLTFDPAAVSPAAVVHALAPRPLLLIQGQRDMLVNWRDAERMAKVSEESTELWLMPSAGHAQCFRKGGEEYKRRVVQFFQKNLPRE